MFSTIFALASAIPRVRSACSSSAAEILLGMQEEFRSAQNRMVDALMGVYGLTTLLEKDHICQSTSGVRGVPACGVQFFKCPVHGVIADGCIAVLLKFMNDVDCLSQLCFIR